MVDAESRFAIGGATRFLRSIKTWGRGLVEDTQSTELIMMETIRRRTVAGQRSLSKCGTRRAITSLNVTENE